MGLYMGQHGVVQVAGRAAVQAAVALARVRVAGFQSRSRRRRPQATATIKEVLSLKNRSAE